MILVFKRPLTEFLGPALTLRNRSSVVIRVDARLWHLPPFSNNNGYVFSGHLQMCHDTHLQLAPHLAACFNEFDHGKLAKVAMQTLKL